MKKLFFLPLILTILFCCKHIKNETTDSKNDINIESQKEYLTLINEATNFYTNKEYSKSSEKFSDAFRILKDKNIPLQDRYNASLSYSLSENNDKAFYHLFKLANEYKYSNYEQITNDDDLSYLHKFTDWSNLISVIKANKEQEESSFDKPLIAKLDSIFSDDQKYRHKLKEIETKYGRNSEQMKFLWDTIKFKDSVNLVKVEKILKERGWLDKSIIGRKGNSQLFFVIQHSNLETQEKYLPMIREAVKKGDLSPSNLAILEDRIAVGKGEKQIYGSQLIRDGKTGEYIVLPLFDPENVDKRRKKIGLEPLSDYLSNWGLEWDIDDYKESKVKLKKE